MLQLRELNLQAFRSASPTTVRFGDGFNFLLGKNGAGKTTLLALIVGVVRHDTLLLTELARRQRLAYTARFTHEHLTLEVALELDPTPEGGEPTGTVTYTLSNAAGPYRVCSLDRSGQLVVSPPQPLAEPFPPRRFSSPNLLKTLFPLDGRADGSSTVFGELQAFAELSETSRFDEGLGTFDRLVDSNGAGSRDLWRTPEWERKGTAVRATAAAHSDASTERPWPPPGDTSLAGALGAKAVRATRRLVGREGGVERYRGVDGWFVWPGGLERAHTELSWGQKRLFALWWYLDTLAPLGVVVADELTNGLHTDYLAALVERIGARQGFYAVQSPLLPDLVPTTTRAQIEECLLLCRWEPGSDAPYVWRNPTPEEAERVERGWNTGLERMGALLKQEGLW